MASGSKIREVVVIIVLLTVALVGMVVLYQRSAVMKGAAAPQPMTLASASDAAVAPVAPVMPVVPKTDTIPPPVPVAPPPPPPSPPPSSQATGAGDLQKLQRPAEHRALHRGVVPTTAPVPKQQASGAIAGDAGSMPSAVVAPPPATAAALPPPVEDDAAKLDDALKQLKPGNLAYSTPTQMKMAETAHVVAKIATDAVSVDALKAALPTDTGTQIAAATTSVTPTMKMTLTSGDFDITPLSTEEQMVGGTSPTTWEWDILPKHSGQLRLHLAAVIELNGAAKDFTTVDREIAVQVDPADVVGDFVKTNWQWIIATLTALGGAVWRFFAARKKGAAASAADA